MEALTRRHLKELSRSLPSPTAILDIAGIVTAPQKNHPPSEPIMTRCSTSDSRWGAERTWESGLARMSSLISRSRRLRKLR